MPLKDYGVLVGRVADRRIEAGNDSPHYQVHVVAGGIAYRIAVNVRSAQSPPDLLYIADEAFKHPLLPILDALSDGFNGVPSGPGGVALDYIRGNLFDRNAMRTLPSVSPGPDNDLSDKIDHFLTRAINDPTARIFAFGERWGPEQTTPDKVFGFSPGNGIHDIHMNQGNSGSFSRDNGVWQDGGVLLRFPEQDQWVAIFLAFQSQAWHTDDATGDPIGDPGGGSDPDNKVRIIGALVNPIGPAPESEWITLLNTTPDDIDLTGWAVLDRLKQRMPLGPQILSAGETIRVPVQPPVQLGNNGGLITVVDGAGLKVDGVSYTGQQAGREGWTIVF
jgi:uncharacterized protein YukJ